MASLAFAPASPLGFPARLRAAWATPAVSWASALALTFAALWTWVQTTLLMNPAFQPMGDFRAYYNAAADLNAGLDPYLRYNPNIPFSLSLGYIYPPLLARILQPLAHTGFAASALAMTLANQAFVALTAVLLWRILALRSWPSRLLALDLFWLSSAIVANIQVGQINLCLMLLTAIFLAAYPTRPKMAFAAAALQAALKLTTLPLLGLALLRKRWSALALAAAIGVGSALAGGVGLTLEYFTRVFPKLTATVPAGAQNTSLLADIERFLHPGSDNLAYDPSYPEAKPIFLALAAIVLLLTFLALRRLRPGLLEASAALAAVPLLTSYLGSAHLMPFVPAYIWLAAYAWRTRAYLPAIAITLSLAMILDYPLFYTLATSLNYFIARAAFYELGPGLAAAAIWACALRLASRAPAPA